MMYDVSFSLSFSLLTITYVERDAAVGDDGFGIESGVCLLFSSILLCVVMAGIWSSGRFMTKTVTLASTTQEVWRWA